MKLLPPCSYQGGKQRLASKIVDIIFQEHKYKINDDTKFFDLCCGSGAFSLELVNRGIHPNNIVMIDAGCMGAFWESIAVNEFDLDLFRKKIDDLPSIENIQPYLKNLSTQNPDENMIYNYLLLQAGAFGSKQIWIEDNKWQNCSFRNYWLPTETSNRKSPVNPMMPMPETLFERVKNIVDSIGGCITAHHGYVENYFDWYFNADSDSNAIVYIDPPYKNTTQYGFKIDITNVVSGIWNNVPIYISEGYKIDWATKSWLLSKGRTKGNISGDRLKSPTEEWLNLFY